VAHIQSVNKLSMGGFTSEAALVEARHRVRLDERSEH
jgi:hypothetical protein